MTSNSSGKEWAVMVYLATESSLAQENVFNLTEMKKIGVRGKLRAKANVIAWLETGPGPSEGIAYSLTGSTSGDPEESPPPSTRRYYKEGQLSENIDHDLLKHRRECPNCRTQYLKGSTYAERIVTFVKAVMDHYEANHYALILSGHGQGWMGDFIMQGEDGRSALTLPGLKATLEKILGKEGRKLDILGMDSCLMSMTEVCYEVQDHAKILIGAEGFEPLAGWPYASVLEQIEGWEEGNDDDENDERLKHLAKDIVEGYVTYYSDYADGGISVDLSACDLGKQKELAGAILVLSKALRVGFIESKNSDFERFKDHVILAHWECQQYRSGQYVDLYDFCKCLGKRLPEVSKECENVMKVIGDCQADKFILKSCYSGPLVQYSYGVSIYFPWAKPLNLEQYSDLAFCKETQWDEFLNVYLEKTQRVRRGYSNSERESLGAPRARPIAEPTALRRLNYATRNGSFNKDIESIIGCMSNPATEYEECECLTRLRPQESKTPR